MFVVGQHFLVTLWRLLKFWRMIKVPIACPYCGNLGNSRADVAKHIQVFHPNLSEEEKLKKIRENPRAWIVEHGFEKELRLVQEGKCPMCARHVLMEELYGSREMQEWKISGVCGPCQRKLKEGKL